MQDGDHSGDGNVQHYQARKLKVKTSPKQDVMADGVDLGRGTVTIKVCPGALRVITTQIIPGQDSLPKDSGDKLTESVTPTVDKTV